MKFTNPLGSNMCYSNACVNALLASQYLLSHIDPNHDGINSCGICWFFSYYSRVSQLQPNQVHSSEGLKRRIARIANQFIGNRQQDPTEYIEAIVNQCSVFKELTSQQSVQTYTCISCNHKTPKLDYKNVLMQPLRKEDETLSLDQILSKP